MVCKFMILNKFMNFMMDLYSLVDRFFIVTWLVVSSANFRIADDVSSLHIHKNRFSKIVIRDIKSLHTHFRPF